MVCSLVVLFDKKMKGWDALGGKDGGKIGVRGRGCRIVGVAQRSNRGLRIPILVANAVSTKVIDGYE